MGKKKKEEIELKELGVVYSSSGGGGENKKKKKKKARKRIRCAIICGFLSVLLLVVVIAVVLVAIGLSIYFSLFPPSKTKSISSANKILPSWARFAFDTQLFLARDIPIDQHVRIGSHKSYNSAGYGKVYDLAPSQYYTIEEQLSLGVRTLELDLHYISSFTVPLRVCRGSENTIDAYSYCEANENWCKIIQVKNLGPENTGCPDDALTLQAVFEEINGWLLEKNAAKDVIIVKINDIISVADYNSADVVTTLNTMIASTFGSAVLTPEETREYMATHNGQWPTLRWMQNNDKSVILYNSTRSDANMPAHPKAHTFIHDALAFAEAPDNRISLLNSADCTLLAITPPKSFMYFYEDTSVIKTWVTGTIYDGPSQIGVIDETAAKQLLRCGYGASIDKVSAETVQKLIWTWNETQPTLTENACALMNSAGRWESMPCNHQASDGYPFVCAPMIPGDREWLLSDDVGAWVDYPNQCPPGYYFATPALPDVSAKVADLIALRGSGGAWISFNDVDGDGSWVINAP